MKILIRWFCIFTTFVSAGDLFAQKVLNEGVLIYNISIETAVGEKLLSNALNGAVLTVYLTKDKSRSELVSSAGTEANVFDNTASKGFILKEYSGQKLLISTTAANRTQKNLNNSSLDFKTEADNITLGDYNARKAVAQGADGKTVTVYYDPSVSISNKTYNNAFPQIAGLPVQYELRSGNLTFKYSLVKNSSEAIAANKFDPPKGGYRTMTYEENQQLKKGE